MNLKLLFSLAIIITVFINIIFFFTLSKNTSIKFKKITYILLSIIFFVLGNISIFYIFNQKIENTSKTDEEVIEKVLENNDKVVEDNFTKAGVLDATNAMLRAFEEAPDSEMSIEKRIEGLDTKKDLKKYVTNEALNYIYLNDFMKDDEGYYTTSIAILSFIQSVKDKGNNSLSPVIDSDEYIYLDENSRTAQVPVDYFTGQGSFISFEMNYKDKQWKLAPYTLLQSLQLSNQVAKANE